MFIAGSCEEGGGDDGEGDASDSGTKVPSSIVPSFRNRKRFECTRGHVRRAECDFDSCAQCMSISRARHVVPSVPNPNPNG